MDSETSLLVLRAGLLGGCATAPHVAPINHGSRVAFLVVMTPPTAGAASVHNNTVGQDATSGATVGLADALSKDKLGQLHIRFKRLRQSVDPVPELRTEVLAKADKYWSLTDETSGTVVTLEVQNLFLTVDRQETVVLVMQVLVRQHSGTTSGKQPPAIPKRYSVVTQGSSLAAWLDERSDLPESQLRCACKQIATQVVSELAFN